MILRLEISVATLHHVLENLVNASVRSVLDWPHPLLGLRYALEVEVSAEFAQRLEHIKMAGADGEENCAEAFVDALLVHVNLLFPLYCQVDFLLDCL